MKKGADTRLEYRVVKVGFTVIFVAILALIGCLSLYKYNFSGPLSSAQEVWGQFGDFLGGTLNPIFSLLSLIAILVTLFVQTRELSNSTETLRTQSINFKVQAFETSFFTLIRMKSETLKAIDLEETEPDEFVGVRAFRKLYQRFEHSYNVQKKRTSDGELIISKSYDRFYRNNQRFIGTYMRTIQQIFIFIVDRSPEGQEKYWEIIRSQMSTYELLIIYYHCIAKQDYFDKEILYHTGFFDYLENDKLFHSSHTILNKRNTN